MINSYGWQGIFKIKVFNKDTGKFEEETINNRIMDVALSELIGTLNNVAPDLELKFLALGISNIPITDNQTQLGNEIFRTQYATRETTNNSELTSSFSVLDTEAVGQIEEIGIFAGATATSTVNTGTMISRILWSKNKTSQEEIQFTRIDRMVRA